MDKIAGYTTDDIREAVKQIKKIKPDYTLMLDLYEKIYISQEKTKNIIRLKEFIIPKEILSAKIQEKFPLINISQFNIDSSASEKLFRSLSGILLEAGSELSDSVKKLTDLADKGQIDLINLFTGFLKEDESLFDSIENEFGIDKQILGFLIYNSIKPSLSLFSEKMSAYLDNEKIWDKGYCPVCGSMPEISIFGEGGKRFLICSFCSHEWESRRIYCPFCENTDHETLQYYHIEDEEEYRVDVCEKCKKYIKTVDIKKTTRVVFYPLENQATPYIDLKFAEMGYKPGSAETD